MLQKVTFLIASGPSLTQSDIDRVRGLGKVVAINNQIFHAPWADVLYACDAHWWEEYQDRIPKEFTGERLTVSAYHYRYGAKRIPSMKSKSPADGFGKGYVYTGQNGGFQALNWEINLQTPVVCLLGYDYQHTGGKKHNHPDHKGKRRRMGNAAGVAKWVEYMNAAACDTRQTTVINCTRETSLTCFERMELEAFIERYCNT